MAKKDYFLLIDTETTQNQLVADFGAIICDRKGQIFNQCAVMVDGIYTDSVNNPLFFDSKAPSSALWSKESADKRYQVYNAMIKEGSRMIASVAGINSWLTKAKAQYNPVLTAYNLSFDSGKCLNSLINLTLFNRNFDLMAVAQNMVLKDKKFLRFCLKNHLFSNRTKLGNMVFQMKAETLGNYYSQAINEEPHTALEDVTFFELPILLQVLKKYSVRKILNKNWSSVAWQNRQVKDFYKVK
jgi:hypothetical protein